MARPGKTHTSEDIWHLSIDDLLAPPKEPARLADSGPFVINLSTSTAAIGPPPKGLRKFDGLHLYQLRRGPAGQPQFLLRLGIIATEIEADAILSDVLGCYPGAKRESVADDDSAAIAAKTRPAEPPQPPQPTAIRPPEGQPSPPKTEPFSPTIAVKSQDPFHWEIDKLLPELAVTRVSPAIEIEFSAPAPADAAPTCVSVEEIESDPNAVTHEVEPPAFAFGATEIEAHAHGVITLEIPTADAPRVSESVATEVHDAQIEEASAPNSNDDSGTLEQLVAKIGALVESVDAHAAEPAPASAPMIDRTQTVRALTPLELADDQASQCFSIQLALSEEHIEPEHVPSLDIFNEYRLYSVTGLDNDRVMHALRLGFFSSALAAEAVAGYLRGFFDSPCIKRVSLAERERFVEKGITACKDIGETGLHTVIELSGPTPLPERRARVRDSSKHHEPKSVWSRLVAPLKR